MTLAPGEERQVQVPLAPGQRAALVTATTHRGFRPSESTPGSRDERFLGVWVTSVSARSAWLPDRRTALEADHPSEVQAFELQVAVVVFDLVDDVERPIPALGADVVGEVHRAVQVDVEVAAAVALDFRQLEERELAGDRDVGRDVPASDEADRRNRRAGVDELRVEGVRQRASTSVYLASSTRPTNPRSR